MYDSKYIEKLVSEHLSGDVFVVNVSVSPTNRIKVLIDSDTAVSIAYCAGLSRYLESQLDREEEDFELEVSSYGIGEPMLLPRQYHKSIGKQITVITHDGLSHTGELKAFDDKNLELVLSLTKKQIKQNLPNTVVIERENIKEARKVISFK